MTSPKQKKELAVSDQQENKTMIIGEILGYCAVGFFIINLTYICIEATVLSQLRIQIERLERELKQYTIKEQHDKIIKEYNDAHQNNKTL